MAASGLPVHKAPAFAPAGPVCRHAVFEGNRIRPDWQEKTEDSRRWLGMEQFNGTAIAQPLSGSVGHPDIRMMIPMGLWLRDWEKQAMNKYRV